VWEPKGPLGLPHAEFSVEYVSRMIRAGVGRDVFAYVRAVIRICVQICVGHLCVGHMCVGRDLFMCVQ